MGGGTPAHMGTDGKKSTGPPPPPLRLGVGKNKTGAPCRLTATATAQATHVCAQRGLPKDDGHVPQGLASTPPRDAPLAT